MFKQIGQLLLNHLIKIQNLTVPYLSFQAPTLSCVRLQVLKVNEAAATVSHMQEYGWCTDGRGEQTAFLLERNTEH